MGTPIPITDKFIFSFLITNVTPTIFLLEQHEQRCELFQRKLKRMKYRCKATSSPTEFYALFVQSQQKNGTLPIGFIDCDYPTKTIFQLMVLLRGLEVEILTRKALPWSMLYGLMGRTSFGEEDGFMCGMTRVFPKPCSPRDLEFMMEKAKMDWDAIVIRHFAK